MKRTVIAAALMVAGVAVTAQQLPPGSTEMIPDDPTAIFEVASVKRSDPASVGGRMMVTPTQVTLTGIPARLMLRNAYRLQDDQIIGAPDWLMSERFDVVAKPPEGTPPAKMPLMLRNLLKERFKFAAHTETREMPIYALVPARSDRRLGPKLTPTSEECRAQMTAARAGGPGGGRRGGPPPDPNGPAPCGFARFGGSVINASGQPISGLAQALAGVTGRTVLDKTGLEGFYDYELKFAPEPGQGGPLGPLPPGIAPPAVDPDTPGLFTAIQEQLGLKLEGQKGPVQVLVVDRIERPMVD